MENIEEQLQCLPYEETIYSLPSFSSTSGQTSDQTRQSRRQPVLVVLDDDPTGTQTCYGINVLTVWDHKTLVEELTSGTAGFFILTNSRALPTREARKLITTICTALKKAAETADREFEVVLRGDSTLRGHFPDEPEVAEAVLGSVDGWILAPFFEQGGRLTINDVHYVRTNDQLVPAAQTPFAKDATFGYRSSNLREYVIEKSRGSIDESQIHSISLREIRTGGASVVCDRLLRMHRGAVIIVNAVVTADMDVFIQGLLQANEQGKRFIYRTGAAFVSSRLGLAQIPPVDPKTLGMDLSSQAPGGLIIAGSYVPKTTAQLKVLTESHELNLRVICLDVEQLLETPGSMRATVFRAADEAAEHINAGQDVLLMTSRKLITGNDGESSLKIGQVVAEALVLFLRLLIPRPRYIIAKGGITSSDAATKGLGMKRARICGQAASGVPLWQCHETSSKFKSIPYVVFPGNVGEDTTLRDLVASWARPAPGVKVPPAMQYQRLGSSGLKLSRLILGCMTFGNPDWQGSPWVMSEAEALPLLKKAYDVGINTWETADTYSNGQSEEIIGKALKHYNIPRSKVVLMTKIYYPVLEDTPDLRIEPAINDGPIVNQMGLSRKHIFEAVEGSLRRLNTTYIDVLQLHRLDRNTDPLEIMTALHDLVKLGKVHYLGASSMHCWEFARLHYTAKLHNLTPFSSMSGLYNLLYREEEREMVPFCNAEGIGLLPWSPIARGLLTRPSTETSDRSRKDAKAGKWFKGDASVKIIDRVSEMARAKGCSMADVALAWVLSKGTCPVIGLNSVSRIEKATKVFEVDLTGEDMRVLEELYGALEVQAI